MNKIPTLFVRNPDDRKHVLDEVTPGCEWVLAGEGRATRKYDGTCVMLDDDGRWWARREVKPGKTPPSNYVPISTDEVTGKTMGWEPIEQSGFVAAWRLAIDAEWWLPYNLNPGTFELVGPKVNGNPEGIPEHCLVRHGYEAYNDRDTIEAVSDLPTFEGLREQLTAIDWEGVVWHHPDGRMAKLKRRDFPEVSR